jgi:LytS/YehU family sensor histidine kinase
VANKGDSLNRTDLALEAPDEAPENAGEALRINEPFFIGAIGSLANLAILEDAKQTNRMAVLLADHLKSLSQGENRNLTPLADELKNVERYLTMQKLRYGELLDFDIDLPPSLRDCLIVSDSVLSYTERAVCLGLSTGAEPLKLSVAAKKDGRTLTVEMTDNHFVSDLPSEVYPEWPFHHDSEIRAITLRLEAAARRLNDRYGPEASFSLSQYEDSAAGAAGSVCRLCWPISPSASA